MDASAPRSPARPLRARLRGLGPWLLAAAVLAWIFHRLPLHTVGAALARGPWPQLVAYVAVEIAIVLLCDVAAAAVAVRVSGGAVPFARLLRMRGATYLLSIVHPVAGQGSFGWFLAREGRGGWNAGGVVLLLLVTQALALGTGGAAGLLLAPPWLRAPALPVVALIGAGMLVYLAVVAARPRRLARVALLEPLFAAGVRGHLETIAARLPHVAALVLLQWGAFRVWGIAVPLLVALGLIPLVLFVGALPITPGGLGTVQALQATLFARYAMGATDQARQASVVALSLAHAALGIAAQLLIGAVCMRMLGGLRAVDAAE